MQVFVTINNVGMMINADGICDKGLIWNPWKKLVDKLIEERTENIDEVKIAGKALFGNASFIYYKYENHDKKTASKYGYVYQTSNY